MEIQLVRVALGPMKEQGTEHFGGIIISDNSYTLKIQSCSYAFQKFIDWDSGERSSKAICQD